MLPAWISEAVNHTMFQWIIGCNPGRKYSQEDYDSHQKEADKGYLIF
jgi:hypothetical protein